MRSLARRLGAGLAGALLSLPLLVATAAPSEAALISGCSLSATRPFTDGVTTFGTATGSCTGGNAYMDYTNSRIQRQETISWSSGPWYYGNPVPAQVSISKQSQLNCNGTGTRTWRTNGQAGDIYGGTATVYTTGQSLTC